MGNRIFLFRIIHVYLARYFTIWKTWYIKFLFLFEGDILFGIEIYDYIFQLYIGSKSILLVKLSEIWQDISWENGNIYAEEGKNSFNSFLRYSYFQLTTSLYINPQVVYITQHTHTDLELILKRILKIMISKGVAGTKNSFSVFNFEVMTQSILYPYIHWYSFLLLQSIFYAYIAEQKSIIHSVFVQSEIILAR